jgi:hypothetical protein
MSFGSQRRRQTVPNDVDGDSRPAQFRGGIDEPAPGTHVPSSSTLTVRGWSAWDDQPAIAVTVTVNGVTAGRATVGSELRPDVAEALGNPQLAAAGWRVDADLSVLSGLATGLSAEIRVSVWAEPSSAPVELGPVTVLVDGADALAGRDRVDQAAVPPGPGGDLESRVSRLESRLAFLEGDLIRSDGTRVLPELTANVSAHTEWLTNLERWVRSCVRTLGNFGSQPLADGSGASGKPDFGATIMARLEVATVMDWVATVAEVPEGPLVSVNIATHNRPAMLTEAIESVWRQSYQRFEIVVADDSDTDETQQLLASIDDPRLRVLRTPERRGPSLTFNTALDASTGDIIVFLDDDNLMHPEWLRTVVWAFTSFPEIETLYGGRVNEDPGADRNVPSGMLPTLEFARYDAERYKKANYVDRNTIALRSSLQGIRFDESVAGAEDWEHALRLFARAEPLALPAVACYYRTLVPGRMSDQAGVVETIEGLRQRNARG